MRISLSFILFGACSVATTSAPAGSLFAAAPPPCPVLEKASSEQVLNYLGKERSVLNGSCIEYALNRLSADGSAAALPLLIQFLDYKKPAPTANPEEPVIGVQWPLGEAYPAAVAILDFKSRAAASLVQAIGDPELSELIRANAGEVLMVVTHDRSKTIAALIRASRAGTNPKSSILLREAARKVVESCRGESRSACENALN